MQLRTTHAANLQTIATQLDKSGHNRTKVYKIRQKWTQSGKKMDTIRQKWSQIDKIKQTKVNNTKTLRPACQPLNLCDLIV